MGYNKENKTSERERRIKGMTVNICNTAGWGELANPYKETLKQFSLKVEKRGDGREYATIELNSLQDILDVVSQVGTDIIIRSFSFGEDVTLEIYDDWRE